MDKDKIYKIDTTPYEGCNFNIGLDRCDGESNSEADIYTYQRLKNQDYNSGWNHIGNGNTITKLYIKKDGIEVTLDDKDILNLLKSLKPFDGRL